MKKISDDTLVRSALLTAVILLIVLLFGLSACTTSRGGCGTWKDVQRHDRKSFRAYVQKDSGMIAWSNEYREAKLISVTRTMKGFKHIFISDESATATIYLYPKLKVGECYLIKNYFFS